MKLSNRSVCMAACVAAVLTASMAFADVPSLNVNINSFTRIGQGLDSTLGELCGTVSPATAGATLPSTLIPVSVTSDPSTSSSRVYTVLADQSGNFCVVINTYTGNASAQAWLPGSSASGAAVTQARIQTPR